MQPVNNIMESPEVIAAAEDQAILNAEPRKWAKLKMVHTPKFRRVSVEIGNEGMIATYRIDYSLRNDGSVYKHYAPYL